MADATAVSENERSKKNSRAESAISYLGGLASDPFLRSQAMIFPIIPIAIIRSGP